MQIHRSSGNFIVFDRASYDNEMRFYIDRIELWRDFTQFASSLDVLEAMRGRLISLSAHQLLTLGNEVGDELDKRAKNRLMTSNL